MSKAQLKEVPRAAEMMWALVYNGPGNRAWMQKPKPDDPGLYRCSDQDPQDNNLRNGSSHHERRLPRSGAGQDLGTRRRRNSRIRRRRRIRISNPVIAFSSPALPRTDVAKPADAPCILTVKTAAGFSDT